MDRHDYHNQQLALQTTSTNSERQRRTAMSYTSDVTKGRGGGSCLWGSRRDVIQVKRIDATRLRARTCFKSRKSADDNKTYRRLVKS